jgi:hypothetical protein
MGESLDLHSANCLQCVQNVIRSEIVHVNFHRFCDPVSHAVIALLVAPCHDLIDELLLIIFLSLR